MLYPMTLEINKNVNIRFIVNNITLLTTLKVFLLQSIGKSGLANLDWQILPGKYCLS